jgi:hypothetical protein
MSNNRNIVFFALSDQMSDVKETEEQAGNKEFISKAR